MRRAAYWAAVLFIFTIPWEVAIRVGAVGRISRAVGLMVAGLWALSVIMRGHGRPLDNFVKAYFLLVLWSGLTMFWTIDVHATLGGFITYVQILRMVLVVLDLFETERGVETALQAFVLGAYVSCVSIFVNWVNAPPTDFPEHQRITALGFEVDGIALIIAVALPAVAGAPPFEKKTVPAATWAVFSCTLVNLQDVTRRIFSEWFPSVPFDHADKPELEVYLPGPAGDDMKCEIWIPVVNK